MPFFSRTDDPEGKHLPRACPLPQVINVELDTRYRLLKILHEQPHLSQRELARIMGISLGKTNFCLQALIKVGLIKAKNFRNSQNKSAYLYMLTPGGIEEKARVTRCFLQCKMAEYESIQREIEELRADIEACEEKA
jgi:EPS-associated MarR family transcriptional regulator